MNLQTSFKPNIFFILIDGMRLDKFSGNNKSSKTPNIDSLVKEGTYFNQAVSSADGTFLSLNCIFNSVYPFRTGVRAKKVILKENNLFDTLKNSKYHIFGFIPNLVSLQPLTEYCKNNDVSYQGTPPVMHLSDGLGNKILEKLSENKMNEPWFCYLHVLDLHHPHVISQKFNEKKYGNNSYDRIVSEIDFWIGKILNKVNLKNTLVIITGDHGMNIPVDNRTINDFEPSLASGIKMGKQIMPKSTHMLGAKLFIRFRHLVRNIRLVKANHKLTSYEKRSRLPYFTLSLYDEAIRVPLLFSGFNMSSKIISQQVGTIDIFPTIKEIINVEKKNDIFDGESLLPLIFNKSINPRPLYLHTMPYECISKYDKVGIRTSRYKYFRSSHNQKENIHLYDLDGDPMENSNIADTNPSIVEKMEKILTEISKNNKETEYVEDDEETKKIQIELRKLGYLG